MKMKKVGRLLSLVVAGAMALSMIPAAFAADDDTAHVQPTSCFHENVTYVSNGDGTHQEICNDCKLEERMSCTFMDGKCTKCDAPDPTCEHVDQSPTDNGDGTCSYVCNTCHKVISTQPHVYYDGETACALCGAPKPACNHMNQNFKFVANNNGTHDVLCGDCDATLSENVPCDYVNGECMNCHAVCQHLANSWEYESTGYGFHKVLCKDCKKVVDEEGCTYVNGECQKCHDADPTEKPCDHVNQIPVNNGDGTCSYVCKDCNTVIDTQAHVYYNGETACARCGAVCEHVNQTAKDNGDGTCSYVCDTCHTVIDTVAHIYYDGEDTCARCGAGKAACKHLNENYEYVDNGNGTHNVVCADCGAVAQENVACDYILDECVHCGGLYAGGNVPFFVSTGKGLLRSLRSFFMSIFIR